MKSKNQTLQIIKTLKTDYPDALCALEYEHDYELLFSARLAAQCTDERVNTVAKTLYSRYTSLEAFAGADQDELAEIIHSCGFFRIKSRDIILCAQMLIERFGGKVPDNMDDLLRLPGVGRKTANLMLGDIYNKPAVVVDTHCIRITNKLGFTQSKDPKKVEDDLWAQLPPEEASDFCHRIVLHGRAVCVARKPKCEICSLSEWCDDYQARTGNHK